MIRVMLVDDEEWCLNELCGMIKSIGFVEVVGLHLFSIEALEAFESELPDVVFIDVQMSSVTGLDLAIRLKEKRADLKIILTSEDECFARHGFDIGVDDFVLKPFRKERILKALIRAG